MHTRPGPQTEPEARAVQKGSVGGPMARCYFDDGGCFCGYSSAGLVQLGERRKPYFHPGHVHEGTRKMQRRGHEADGEAEARSRWEQREFFEILLASRIFFLMPEKSAWSSCMSTCDMCNVSGPARCILERASFCCSCITH